MATSSEGKDVRDNKRAQKIARLKHKLKDAQATLRNLMIVIK